MQRGVELERAGRYAEAAAAYQAHLNASGHPDGDGYVAGERLGFLYANGRGVPKDVARARVLFSANEIERNRIDLGLLNHGMLPQNPEAKTPELVARISQILAREKLARDAAMMREMMERAEQANKASPRQGASGSNPYSSSCRQMVANGHNMMAGMSNCVPF
jgi:TPR repeat protein